MNGPDLEAIRCQREVSSFVAACAGLLVVVFLVPWLEVPLLIPVVIAMAIACASAIIRHATILATSVPIEHALGPAWQQEVDRLLHVVQRPQGSVSVVVFNNANPNAFASWGWPGSRCIALTSGLVEMARERPEALRAVIAHELGHLVYGHPNVLFLSGWTALIFEVLLFPPALVLLCWSRKAERSADRLAALLTSPAIVSETIVGLHQGRMPKTSQVHALLARSGSKNAVTNFLSRGGEVLATHPFMRPRVQSLLDLAGSAPSQKWWKHELTDRWLVDLATLATAG